MLIPHQSIPQDTLYNLVREFILREGTDYGETKVPLERKIQQVLLQITEGKLVITYSEEYETCDIKPANHPN